MTELPEYLYISEVKDRLRVGKNKVYQMIASGELPVRRFGPRTFRVRRKDLEAWEEQNA